MINLIFDSAHYARKGIVKLVGNSCCKPSNSSKALALDKCPGSFINELLEGGREFLQFCIGICIVKCKGHIVGKHYKNLGFLSCVQVYCMLFSEEKV